MGVLNFLFRVKNSKEMDLLRLVLAHQDITTLSKFTALFKSEQFQRQRCRVRSYEYDADSTRSTSLAGEISQSTKLVIYYDSVLARAVFLRQPRVVAEVADHSNKLDFWLLIESGIPEAQAKAICAYMFHHDETIPKERRGTQVLKDCMDHHNDLTTVPWTPRLLQILVSLQRGKKDSFLCGFLRLPLEDKNKMSWSYYIGFCQRVLDESETFDEIDELEQAYKIVSRSKSYAMKDHFKGYDVSSWETGKLLDRTRRLIIMSGYLRPLLPVLNKNSSWNIVHDATSYASLQLLKRCMVHIDISNFPEARFKEYILSRWFRRRVELILTDEKVSKALNPSVIAKYRAIAYGEFEEEFDNLQCKLGVPVATRDSSTSWSEDMQYKSLQGISFYDSKSYVKVLESNNIRHRGSCLLYVDAYRKGGRSNSIQVPDGTPFYRPMIDRSGRYQRILAYLKGEAETWES